MVAQQSPLIHPSSFLEPSAHEPDLLRILDSPVTQDIIDYVVDFTSDVVDFALSRPGPSSLKRNPRQRSDATFAALAARVIRTAEVSMPTLLVACVYMHRAKRHLQIALEQWACERVFLGALVLASKYCNDSTLKNVHWAWATGTFGKSDMLRIEREFLDVLDFELGVREHELLPHQLRLSGAVAPAPAPAALAATPSSAKPKRSRTSRKASTSRSSLPELSSPTSSSSSSSSASSSPRTPPHSAPRFPPGLTPRAKGTADAPIDVDVPMDVDDADSPLEPETGKSKTRPVRPRRTASTLDVLRAIQFPRKARAAPPKVVARPVVPPRSSEVWV